MTKALFVMHSAEPSGAELGILRLAATIRDIDIAAAFTEDGPMVERMSSAGIETLVLPSAFDSRSMTLQDRRVRKMLMGALSLVGVGWKLGALTRKSQITVLVPHSTKALLVCAIAGRRSRVPVVWHTHDRISTEYFGALLATMIRALGWIVSRGYIANSHSTLASLNRWRRPAIVAYPGLELGTGQRREPQRSSAEIVITVVGRLTPWKGQDVFLRAVAAAKIRPKEIYIVGGALFDEHLYRAELVRLTEQLDLPVTFTGHVDNPEVYMRRADIMVHCSVIAEPFGQVVAEGMNAGCAVIATRPGGPTEVIDQGVNGILVDGADQAQLTSAIDLLICDRELRTRLSNAARLRALDFDISKSAADVTLFLKKISTSYDRKRRKNE